MNKIKACKIIDCDFKIILISLFDKLADLKQTDKIN